MQRSAVPGTRTAANRCTGLRCQGSEGTQVTVSVSVSVHTGGLLQTEQRSLTTVTYSDDKSWKQSD